MLRHFRNIVIGLLTFLLLAGCTQQSSERTVITEQAAQLVSQVTAGVVSADDVIRVRFNEPVVSPDRIGKLIQDGILLFKPAIRGQASWADVQTLVFTPDEPLSVREQYLATLNLQAIFAPDSERLLDPLQFSFRVAGQEVASIDAGFVLKDQDSPEYLYYTGLIRFSQPVTREQLDKSLSLTLDGRSLKVEIMASTDGRVYNFKSDIIKRQSHQQDLMLRIKRKPLNLPQNYERRVALPALDKLRVVSSEVQSGPRIRLEFSDRLDSRQNIEGLVQVDDLDELRLQRDGKVVLLDADFKAGEEYRVVIHPGIKSVWGTRLEQRDYRLVKTPDHKPQIEFSSDGVFLPSANQRKLRFKTMNVGKVQLEIKRVYESNIGQFLQTEKLNSAKDRRDNFDYSYVNRVGVVVAEQELVIGKDKNVWLQHELDLNQLIKPGDTGLYLINLSFKKDDMLLADKSSSQSEDYYGDDYYSNPYRSGYARRFGQVYKPLVVSDIGLTHIAGRSRQIVYASHVADAAPMAGVRVRLLSFQNQVLASKLTDQQGRAEFDRVEGDVFYVDATRDGQRSLVKPSEMSWNTSSFDTVGQKLNKDGIRAFIYTDRGVYRPGDVIHLGLIARNREGSFPQDHPVTLKLYNPRGQLVHKQTNSNARDGFYTFELSSKPDDPTGNWRADLVVGSTTFNHTIKIETVVPFRLKVRLEPQQKALAPGDSELNFKLVSSYLFGTPAAGLDAEVDVELFSKAKSFDGYPGFSFVDESKEFKRIEQDLFKGQLDSAGVRELNWQLPNLSAAPSAIEAVIKARVLEKGGRPNLNMIKIPIDPYTHYVGLQQPDLEWGYAAIGSAMKLPLVVVGADGKAEAGRPLTWRIYRNNSYWWWEFENEHDYRVRYKKHRTTELLASGELQSGRVPVLLEYTPEKRGKYLVEVEDQAGHKAAYFFWASAWGDSPAGRDANVIALKTDRDQYAPGDVAKLTFPAPGDARVLVNLEREGKILHSMWYRPSGDAEMSVSLPLDKSMVPNAYATVSIVQPHAQTANDRPLRMYGIVPIFVSDSSSRQDVQISCADELQPNESFRVEVQAEPNTQFTIAVVDEGLLDLTGFKTPDPWNHFFARRGYDLKISDLYDYVIGANKGDLLHSFSIGGGLAAYRKGQLEEGRRKRFKSVALFKGPITTDEKGLAQAEFVMPDYVGAVRIMAVAAKGDSYGRAEKSVPVKTDLMVQPTLPRLLGPTDRFKLPVTVFAMRDGLGMVDVELSVDGPLKIVGPDNLQLKLDRAGEQEVMFELQAAAAVGQAAVTLKARSSGAMHQSRTDINVRAAAPRSYTTHKELVKPGADLEMMIPADGIEGTNRARLIVANRPNLNIDSRLRWLIRYPYGCIEQTVSSVFPQLYLADILATPEQRPEIDRNINAAIARLRKFQLASGGFAYWPGGRHESAWGSSYAGHFLIEAKALGYHVPEDMLSGWARYTRGQARLTRDNLTTRLYRVYLLALYGEPHMSAMNLLKEGSLAEMSDTEKWMLAGAYHLAGSERTAQQILRKTGVSVREYLEFSNTYGSTRRDQAIILEMMVLTDRLGQAGRLADDIGAALSSQSWYSTQSTAYMLLALGKYLKSVDGPLGLEISGRVYLPDGSIREFRSGNEPLVLQLEQGFGSALRIEADSASGKVFAALEWDGVPLMSSEEELSRNLDLKVRWLNEDGVEIDPAELAQGAVFWGHFRVSKQEYSENIEELALVQILPAGWEIENVRLNDESLPSWMSNMELGHEEYLDIRDDRIMWFFDMPGYRTNYDFMVKLNAVTVGDFTRPQALLEAMYDDRYKAIRKGGAVKVTARSESLQ